MKYLKIIYVFIILHTMEIHFTYAQLCQPGVSQELAISREKKIQSIHYQLSLNIPQSIEESITGSITIEIGLQNPKEDLILDFQNDSSKILQLITNNKHPKFRFENEHIIIPSKHLKKGKNTIKIEFIAGESSLNRNRQYLYSLFVPDKASVAFPCFDQPDLKATYDLELYVPETWVAVSNGKIQKEEKTQNRKYFKFNKTAKISTYHFAFAAGEFIKETRVIKNRTYNFYHREFDETKLASNIDSIFNYHSAALEWMEAYTAIPYPFEKLDFISIPSFQFSGMEHVGIIYYRDSRIFLSKSATLEDVLKKALVIKHEVSHMWFGDLVTMKWFDDVWLKEVFAELMASKMVNPLFTELNHKLNFIATHFPRAYQTDRSIGTNPIKQKLENLKFAGTLYGDIIYYKAPVVMANLELLIGEKALQNGLRDYLKTFKYGNADWNELIAVMSRHTDTDLQNWSRIWVEQEGMPTLEPIVEYSDNKIKLFSIKQSDAFGKDRVWEQKIEILLAYKDNKHFRFPVFIDSPVTIVDGLRDFDKPDFILLNGGGYGYGHFELDSLSKEFLLDSCHTIKDDLTRTIAYLTLYQDLIDFRINAVRYIKSVTKLLKVEKEKQNAQLLLEYLSKSWWQLLNNDERFAMAPEIESTLFELIKSENNRELKSSYFQTLLTVFITKNTSDWFYTIWRNRSDVFGLKISETDYSTITIELSMRDYPGSEKIIEEQYASITDPERKARMKFIMPSVSPNDSVRDDFFESLKKPENRQQEIWVRTGLYYLNHPLRAHYSIKYLKSSLEMLEEIQKTGDIFFPKNWLAYTIGRYNSTEAVDIVTQFLASNPDYNKNLKAKILQLSDILFRAEKIVDKREHFGRLTPIFSSEE
jgi:aminopeptidase N